MKSLEEVNAFMDRIAPNIHFSGRRQFTLAVNETQEDAAPDHVIGRTLEQKPAPGTLLRYCAYYCAAGRSYHQEGAGGAPEPAGRG